jgi:hypothetical protein
MTVQDQIRANAEFIVRKLQQVSDIENFGYNSESVAWVDGIIERQRLRTELDEAAIDRLSDNLSCYLGECVIACYGGKWQQQDGGWAVVFDAGNAVFPFNKVRKQFRNGKEQGDSIFGLFDSISVVFANSINAQDEKKPWWKFW